MLEFLLLFLAVPILLMFTMSLQIVSMSSPRKMLKINHEGSKEILSYLDHGNRVWLNSANIECMNSYDFGSIKFSTWRFLSEKKYLIIYLVKGSLKFDIITLFSGSTSLTTSDSNNSQVFPLLKGDYKECGQCSKLSNIYEQHEISLNYLKSFLNCEVEQGPVDFESNLIESISNSMHYVRSIKFWWIKTLYWFFIRKRRYTGKTIEEQICLGLA